MGWMNRRLAAGCVALGALAGLAGCQAGTDRPAASPTAALAPAAASPSLGATPQAARPTISPAAQPTATDSPPAAAPSATPQPAEQRWDYPIGKADGIPGDGFYIRHGYAAENTWYNPGYWHTGEDWYAQADAETAGAEVYAAAAGTVAYVGGNYPGRVVIISHGELFSMYGHLDPAVLVAEGQAVERGTPLGLVLRRGDAVPNHLHFEVRRFLTTAAVNGASPRHPFRCGPGCPPGPGYWPIADPEPPAALGWRNPTHAIAGRGFAALGS
ncbi:MAG TPA: M23 family metallopeptidase, partial [Herpetosiphonaceae bacterium]